MLKLNSGHQSDTNTVKALQCLSSNSMPMLLTMTQLQVYFPEIK